MLTTPRLCRAHAVLVLTTPQLCRAHAVAIAARLFVFEVAFEGLQKSTRHKSGIAMRFPRINRLRWDKPPRDADRLETLQALLERGAARAASPQAAVILPPGNMVK